MVLGIFGLVGFGSEDSAIGSQALRFKLVVYMVP